MQEFVELNALLIMDLTACECMYVCEWGCGHK